MKDILEAAGKSIWKEVGVHALKKAVEAVVSEGIKATAEILKRRRIRLDEYEFSEWKKEVAKTKGEDDESQDDESKDDAKKKDSDGEAKKPAEPPSDESPDAPEDPPDEPVDDRPGEPAPVDEEPEPEPAPPEKSSADGVSG